MDVFTSVLYGRGMKERKTTGKRHEMSASRMYRMNECAVFVNTPSYYVTYKIVTLLYVNFVSNKKYILLL